MTAWQNREVSNKVSENVCYHENISGSPRA